ncbi:MAG: NUDIX domain-containing protein [Candidatus Thorarchaeota archaeon]|nr:NUDIX domain-containing protein [Candidatus Thorarchaeota archaeon]
MKGHTVYWKGRVATGNIEFEHSHERILLSHKLEEIREHIWEETVQQYPNSYDGDILVLEGVSSKNERMILHTKEIKFSRVLVLERIGQKLGEYGTVGLQMAVFSENHQYILYGERAHTEMYCPGLYSLPGGMLEVSDTEGSFDHACMREFLEEVSIDIHEGRHLIGIVKDLHSAVGITLIVKGEAKTKPQAGRQIQGNKEWKDETLKWYDVDSLASLGKHQVLSGLLFLKKEFSALQ